MWPFSQEVKFPGIEVKPDGKVEFTLTAEEQREAEAALAQFKDVLVHRKYAERVRNGAVAVALSNYARELVQPRAVEIESANGKVSRELQIILLKAIAAVWKSFIFSPLPIFTYHRAILLRMLGHEEEAKSLYGSFLEQHAAFHPDQVAEHLMTSTGFDIQKAVAIAMDATAS